MRKAMMAVVIVVVLAGCVTTPQVPPEAKSPTYDVTMQQAFDAVRMFYADNDAQIQAGGISGGGAKTWSHGRKVLLDDWPAAE